MGGSQSKKGQQAIRRADTSADFLRQLGGNLEEKSPEIEEAEEAAIQEAPVHPLSEVMSLDLSSFVDVSVRIEELPEVYTGGVFIVLYAKWGKDVDWVEVGKTETNDEKTYDPIFKKTFMLEYRLEMARELRFEVFRQRQASKDILEEHTFLGGVETTLSQVFVARSKPGENHGWFMQLLDNPLQFMGNSNKKPALPGVLHVYAEEDMDRKQLVSFQVECSGIKSSDKWKNFGRGSPDAYCIVNRTAYRMTRADGGEDDQDEDSEPEMVPELIEIPVYRTEVCRKTKTPSFEPCQMPAASLVHIDPKQDIVIEVFDWFRTAKAEYIGEAKVSFEKMAKHFKDNKPLPLPLTEKEGKGRMTFFQRLKSKTSGPSRTSSRFSMARSRGSSRSPATSKDLPRSRSSTGMRDRGPSLSPALGMSPLARSPSTSKLAKSPSTSKLALGDGDGSRRGSKGQRRGGLSISKLSGASKLSGGTLSSHGSGSFPSGSPGSSVVGDVQKAQRGSRRKSTTSGGGSGSRRNSSALTIGSSASGNSQTAQTPLAKFASSKSVHSAASSQSPGSKRSGGSGSRAKQVGQMRLVNIGCFRRFTFLDYIRSGLQVRHAVAIDLSRSNSKNEAACHGGMAETIGTSPYATAIRAVGKVLAPFDPDEKVLAYGFGAKIPPSHTVCSDCFALSGDYFEPEIEGIEQVIKFYGRALHIVQMHGPTRLAPVIELVSSIAEQFHNPVEGSNRPFVYYVLTIITDGQVNDEMETINAIVASANVPMSTVVIGMGDEDHTFLKDLTMEVTKIRKGKETVVKEHAVDQRQVVHYIPYQMFEDSPEMLASAALADIPREVTGYFKSLEIRPDKLKIFEDERANTPLEKWLPLKAQVGDKGRSNTRSKTRTKTNSQAASRQGSKLGGGASTKLSMASMSSYGNASEMSSYLNGMTAGPEQAKEKKKKETRPQPQMLMDIKEILLTQGLNLGYERHMVLRAFAQGIPSATLEVMLDNIMYAGHNRAPPYRAAARAAIKDVDDDVAASQVLPGQVQNNPLDRTGTKTSAKSTRDKLLKSGSRGGTHLESSALDSSTQSATNLRSASRLKGDESNISLEGVGSPRPGKARGITKDAQAAAEALLQQERRSGSNISSVPEGSGATSAKRSRGTSKVDFRIGEGEEEAQDFALWASAQAAERPGSTGAGAKSEPAKGILSRKGTKQDFDAAGLKKVISFTSPVLVPPSPQTPNLPSPLRDPNEHLSHASAMSSAGTCSICLENIADTKIQPCGHVLACSGCSSKLGSVCPLCQGPISDLVPLDH